MKVRIRHHQERLHQTWSQCKQRWIPTLSENALLRILKKYCCVWLSLVVTGDLQISQNTRGENMNSLWLRCGVFVQGFKALWHRKLLLFSLERLHAFRKLSNIWSKPNKPFPLFYLTLFFTRIYLQISHTATDERGWSLYPWTLMWEHDKRTSNNSSAPRSSTQQATSSAQTQNMDWQAGFSNNLSNADLRIHAMQKYSQTNLVSISLSGSNAKS